MYIERLRVRFSNRMAWENIELFRMIVEIRLVTVLLGDFNLPVSIECVESLKCARFFKLLYILVDTW